MTRWWAVPICAVSLLSIGVGLSAASLGMSRFYPGLYYPNAEAENGATIVPVSGGLGFEGADIALAEAGGTVVGTVVGPAGPVAGLLVQAFRGAIQVAGQTDVAGRYSLEGVPAGSVLVRFSTDRPLSRERGLAAVYLGGSLDSSLALPVEVTNFETQDIGETTLAWGAVVGGRVRTSDGFALENATVRIEETGGASWSIWTGPAGRYKQGGLHPGSYRILVTPPPGAYLPEYFGGARTDDQAALVTMQPPEQRLDLDVELDRGGTISGQVRAEGTNDPHRGFAVEAHERAGGTVARTQTDDLGMYVLEGLPAGSYLVHVPRLNRYFPGVIRAEDARAIQVAEGSVSSRIDVTGADLGGCQLPAGSRGAIQGHLDVDLSRTSEVLVSAFSEVDTVEAVYEEFGPYVLDCVPQGSYLVRFLPRGGYTAQYHPQVMEEAQAVRVTVQGDTARAVDYRPDLSGWIRGRVTAGVGGVGIADVLVSARSRDGRVWAEARTGADGAYRIESLPDGSGLPAGFYRVRAESTLVPDPDVTPVLQPFLSAEVRGENIHVSGVLDGALAWSYRIWRHPVGTSADRADPVLESDHPPGAGAIELIDHPASGTYRYEIEASPAPPLAAPVMRAWSNAVRFEPGVQTRIRAFPDPWNGIGSVRLQRAGLRGATRISVVTVGGRQIATWTWPSGDSETTWEGTDASGRAVPSGVYFLGLRDEVGRLLDVTTIVVER